MLRMAALRRYALSKLFNLELAESIIVCDNGVLLVHSISISGFIIFQDFFFHVMLFDFKCRSYYSVYKVVRKLCFLRPWSGWCSTQSFPLFFDGPDIRRSP